MLLKGNDMRKIFLVFGLLCIAGFLCAQSTDIPALRPIINHFASRNFAPGEVTRAQIDLILQAGIHSPSASNRQPWHFTVVQNQDLAKRIVAQVNDGNILIIVSAAGDGKTNGPVMLDCGLAVQCMYLAAQAIGLASRIYTGPMDTINSRFKTELGLPANHSAIALIRIGRLPAGVDAVSSASARNDAGRMVTYK